MGSKSPTETRRTTDNLSDYGHSGIEIRHWHYAESSYRIQYFESLIWPYSEIIQDHFAVSPLDSAKKRLRRRKSGNRAHLTDFSGMLYCLAKLGCQRPM